MHRRSLESIAMSYQLGSAFGVRPNDVPGMQEVGRLTVDADLSDASLESAILMMSRRFDDTSVAVICGREVAIWSEPLVRKFGLKLFVLPDSMIADVDAWALVGERSLIWSPGA